MSALQDAFGSRFCSRRVLVTGATGFIGAHLCQALVSLGANVSGVSRGIRRPAFRSDYQLHTADMTDPAAVRQLILRLSPEIIFHLAGVVTGRQELDLVLPATKNNLLTTIHLLLGAVDAGCERIVAVGSSQEPVNGTLPSSPYAAAKAAASVYCAMFHAIYGLPVVVVRPHVTYGPGQDSSKLIPYVITSSLRGEAPRVSTGGVTYDFVFVSDVVFGLLKAAAHEDAVGKSFDLGTGTGTKVQDVVQQVASLVGGGVRPIVGGEKDRIGESHRVADCEPTMRAIGWVPARALTDGLPETIAWYRDHANDQ